jgi:hypothetical protein
MSHDLSCFPPGAQEVLERTDEQGCMHFSYYLNGEQVGSRTLGPDGDIWDQALKDGEQHGPERMWNEKGVLVFESRYERGKEHGTARQYSDDGVLIGMYHMEHGTGLDLWRCNLTWTLREERQLRHGERHGFTRWWNEDQRTVWMEEHYIDGQEHGVFRSWNTKGRLARGYPRYYVGGKKVTKRQYLRACRDDPTLPPFREQDNDPERALPQEYLDQVARGIGPRRCGECGIILGTTGVSRCPACGEDA